MMMALSTVSFSNISNTMAENDKIPDRYIVVLKDDENSALTANDFEAKHGIVKDHVYQDALKGFSAKISREKLDKIRNDPRVQFVEEDYVVKMFQNPSQILPSGIDRVDADLNGGAKIDGIDERVNADMAIIDTGIDLTHPDLNVVSDISFVKKVKTGNDDNGHGTHVAGIAAALDNDFGVVGVAPGARLYAVKVLDSTGSGSISQVIAGIDWVTRNSLKIDVANLSLGCFCHSNALHKSIQKSISKGVSFVVAAGNTASDASNFEPSSYPEVIAVSAIADTDGKCGGLGPSSDSGVDDSFASFSNFGSVIDIAAPGVNILSTYKGGTYAVLSGTSMASPHVAGAIAVYLHDKLRDLNNDGKVNADDVGIVRNAILSSSINQNKACNTSLGDGDGGFSNDANGFAEPLLYIKNL